ncbi:MAG: hypothetical protein AAGC88_00960 [Bacteroidota bacterium]
MGTSERLTHAPFFPNMLIIEKQTSVPELVSALKSPEYYRTNGGIYSEQRIEVIEAFLKLNTPVEAEFLWLQMVNSGRKVSLSCVRSSLNWLVDNAPVSRHRNDSGVWEFELDIT